MRRRSSPEFLNYMKYYTYRAEISWLEKIKKQAPTARLAGEVDSLISNHWKDFDSWLEEDICSTSQMTK